MAEYRYYLIPDAMARAFPEQFGKQPPTEFFDNIADLEKRYHQLREMPYNNERTWNERTRFPYTDAPQQPTAESEIASQPVNQQEKQLDLLSLLLDFMPVMLVGAVLFAVRRKRRH